MQGAGKRVALMIWLLPLVGRVPRPVSIGIVVLAVAAFAHFWSQIAMVTGGVSRSNTEEALASISAPTGFAEAGACPGLKDCFQSPSVVQPLSAASVPGLLSRLGVTPGSVDCHTSPAGLNPATLRCQGSVTVSGTPLDFSLTSGAGGLTASMPAQPNAGTEVTLAAP